MHLVLKFIASQIGFLSVDVRHKAMLNPRKNCQEMFKSMEKYHGIAAVFRAAKPPWKFPNS